MQSISELIRAERATSGLSYRDLAARAESAGYSLKFQYLHELARSGPKGWPKSPDTFRALGEMLKIPVREIVLAYAIDLGLDVETTNSDLISRLPDGTDNLSKEMVESLLKLIRTAVNEASRSTQKPLVEDKTTELSLAADSSDNEGKDVVQDLHSLGEEAQEARQRWRRK
ncbi:hypothetical protein [Psychromicrobium sp. YIM B11713]|uniref:hypothetical protein n=1 Tax=Psychromicrobium sp. YIM B11713 TaxID=3145233 RepID=UPI00374E3F43